MQKVKHNGYEWDNTDFYLYKIDYKKFWALIEQHDNISVIEDAYNDFILVYECMDSEFVGATHSHIKCALYLGLDISEFATIVDSCDFDTETDYDEACEDAISFCKD